MANTYPFRLEVLRRLTAVIESIGAPGPYQSYYETDMTNRVFRGRAMFGESDPIPMIAIVEPPVPVEQIPTPDGSDASTGVWELMVQGFVVDDPVNPTDPAQVLSSAVRRRLAFERMKIQGPRKMNQVGILNFGDIANTIEDMFIGEPKVRPSDDISTKAYFWLPVSFKLAEDLSDPLRYKEATS